MGGLNQMKNSDSGKKINVEKEFTESAQRYILTF